MKRLQLRAPAKLNLFLHIIGRRADGYHLLQSVFRAVNLFDELDITVSENSAITRSEGPIEVSPEQDLTVRAARVLQSAMHSQKGADIQLFKRIPMGAGLGGGSSDAAAVLVALNRLWQAETATSSLKVLELEKLALQLGADVPFFVGLGKRDNDGRHYGADAWVEGIGEQLSPIQVPPAVYVIVHPRVHCPTAQLFAHPDLRRDCPPITAADFLAHKETENVFEEVAIKLFPEIGHARAWLRDMTGNARMTGSGSALFASVADQAEAVRVKNSCPPQWQAFFARSLS
jgi:4-diphosphocytidyl-2-C-methyl-D-erythritol kinase